MNLSRLRSILRETLPPACVRLLHRARGAHAVTPFPHPAMDQFYRALLPGCGLCFDIGANIGTRVAALRRIGCRVVAVEPQAKCYQQLRRTFAQDAGVTLVQNAAGRQRGTATMMVSEADVLSSLSTDFIDSTRRSGRFAHVQWDRTETVNIVTLDDLIAQHGRPVFAKIDVEGFELEVIAGLSQPIPLIALEWAPESSDNILGAITLLEAMGAVQLNISWGESMQLAHREWFDRASLAAMFSALRDDTYLFADVYVKFVAANHRADP